MNKKDHSKEEDVIERAYYTLSRMPIYSGTFLYIIMTIIWAFKHPEMLLSIPYFLVGVIFTSKFLVSFFREEYLGRGEKDV